MPTINRLPKKEKLPRNENTDSRLIRRQAYNNTKWRNLRDIFIKEHPLCTECLRNGKVVAAQDIHHLRSPFQNNTINYDLLLDYNNLEALCKECHAKEHLKEQGKLSPQEVIAQLDALFDETITDEEYENK